MPVTELWESRNYEYMFYRQTVLLNSGIFSREDRTEAELAQLGGSSVCAALAEVWRAALAVAVPRPTHHFRPIPRLENARKDHFYEICYN